LEKSRKKRAKLQINSKGRILPAEESAREGVSSQGKAMAIRFGIRCPKCRSKTGGIRRLRRLSWMRRLPASKHFECQECGIRYVFILGCLSITIGQAPY